MSREDAMNPAPGPCLCPRDNSMQLLARAANNHGMLGSVLAGGRRTDAQGKNPRYGGTRRVWRALTPTALGHMSSLWEG